MCLSACLLQLASWASACPCPNVQHPEPLVVKSFSGTNHCYYHYHIINTHHRITAHHHYIPLLHTGSKVQPLPTLQLSHCMLSDTTATPTNGSKHVACLSVRWQRGSPCMCAGWHQCTATSSLCQQPPPCPSSACRGRLCLSQSLRSRPSGLPECCLRGFTCPAWMPCKLKCSISMLTWSDKRCLLGVDTHLNMLCCLYCSL